MEAVVVVDSDSCASTEIDPESVNSCSDIDDVHQGESDDTTTLRFWRGLTNMAHHIYLVDRIPEITWHLPEPAEAHDISHGTRHIRATLNMGVSELKIGITCQPANRWSNSRYGYQHTNYSGVKVIYVFENSDDVAAMETSLIGCYRYIDRSGIRVGSSGHHLCSNRLPGGENAHVGYSPFFVYLVFKRC